MFSAASLLLSMPAFPAPADAPILGTVLFFALMAGLPRVLVWLLQD